MSWAGLRRRLRLRRARLDPNLVRWFEPGDIQGISDLFFTEGPGPGTRWDVLRDAHLRLPSWFRHGLDPLGAEYAAQQQRLWQLISGVDAPYEPELHEKEHDWGDVDPIRAPGYFVRQDPQAIAAASDHVIAAGMFLKHCGLARGERALEYGAGFGQIALTLARFGVEVDTVDISAHFCEMVRRQAEHFRVPLRAHHGHFGFNPEPGRRYKLIYFYEAFHHCLDFQRVVPQLAEMLDEGGRIILGGEPIPERQDDAIPYPWGVRLHSEVVAVVRRQHWFELGFTEPFLFELFAAAGLRGRRIDCEPSLFGRLHVFERVSPAA